MSWINNRQHPGGQPMPPANNSSAAAATALSQSGSVGYGAGVGGGPVQQQQQQGWQQQQLHSYSQPPQPYSPQHNSVYNANPTSNPNGRNVSQQSWQQYQPLSNQYFNKQNPVVDSYSTQNLVAAPTANQTTPQLYQQQNQNNFYSQNAGSNPNATNASNHQSFSRSEIQTTEIMASASLQQNDNPPPKAEGWDDWDWNDNNQSMQSNIQSQQLDHQLQHNSQTYPQQNVISDSFSTDQTDNWNWSTDDAKNSNILQQPSESVQNQFIAQEKQHLMNSYGQSSIGFTSNQNIEDSMKPARPSSVGSPSAGYVQNVLPPPQFAAQQSQQTLQQPQSINQPPPLLNQQIATSVPLSTQSAQQPAIQQSQSTPVQNNFTSEGSSVPVSNNVYVSQAKPVSQPARQFALTPSLTGQASPINTVNNEVESLQASATPALPPPPINQTPPPPPMTTSAGSNPYKRAGVAQHHRVALAPISNLQPTMMQSHFVGPVVGDFQQLQQNSSGNQECLAPDNSEVIDNKNYEVENQEIAPSNDRNQYQEATPSNDRNQYLQTDHLSEERYNNVEMAQEPNEQDSFPPPGLSRLVLGQPEAENPQSNTANQNEIPPGLDRMVPGTELVTAGINMERQADGQDTIPAPRSAYTNVPVAPADSMLANIDIIDRNLYLVAGESDVHEQRIVTGLENGSSQNATEHREVEMDGENLEDQQQQQQQQQQLQHQQQHHHQHHEQHFEDDIEITREEPIEGANTMDSLPSPTANQETESSLTLETNQKDLSNPSTCNDDSDHKGRHSAYYGKSNTRKQDEKRRVPNASDSKQRKERYDTESDYYSSDRDRKFREGSVRSERDKKSKDRDRRDRREGSSRDQDRYRDDKDERDGRRYERDRQRGKSDRDRDRDRERGGRYNNSRYETDSKYETESSVRYERRRGDKERDRDRDRDRQDYDYRRDEKDKRHRRGGDRHERDDRERRRDTDRDYRDRRRGERGRGGASSNEYDEDSYSRRTLSSRNTRDVVDRDYKDRSMRDMKDPRYPANVYSYPQGYGYDAYSYYQHQQYYEQLRRTNPQAYAEWYRKYYGQTQTDLTANDGRESVHSGRSSANNDKERYSYQHPYFQQHSNEYQQQQRHFAQPPSIGSSLNSTTIGERSFNLNGGPSTGNLSQYNLHQLQQQQHMAGVGYPTASTARSYYTQNDYLDTRSDQFNASLNLIDGASTTQEPQRLTPCKFTNDHSIATLANGLLVCVKPKYSSNGITNVVKVWKFAGNDATKRLFNTFPGPLVRGITHKKTIIEFCEDQIRLGPPSIMLRSRNNSVSSICSMGNVNRGSFTLMWNLLILLLRQNGMVVGTDIAELLMKNKNQFPYESNQANSSAIKSASASRRNSILSDQKKTHESQNSPSDDDNENSVESKDDNSEESDSKKSLSEDEITEKFRNYLLYGNVNEALEWATDNNLWGHALFLASKVDRRLHANVMMKFANKLSLNDPLQTLYQLMSGRTPSSVTSVQDEKWGDWRPHLAMILSNTSPRPDLDRKAITTLGDSLYNRGDLFGAQFCYLMAQVGFGRYSSVNQESTLMSNSANAIRLVLLGSSHHKTFKEFATNEAIIMTEIYEYACALNDEKFSIVEFQPYKYLLGLRMLDYGMQLKTLMYMEQISRHIQLEPSKYDTSFIEKVYKISERLKFVDPMLEKSMDDQESTETNQLEDQPWLQDLRIILNESNTAAMQQTNGLPSRSQIDQQFTEINQQISALSIQYDNFESGIDHQEQQPLQHQQSYPGAQSQNDANYQVQYQQQVANSGIDGTQQSTDQYGNYYNNQQQMPSLPGQENATSDYDSYGPQSYEPQPNYTQEQYQNIPPTHNQQQEGEYSYWNQQNQSVEPSGQITTDQVSATPPPPQITTPLSVHEASSTHSSSIATISTPNNLTTHSRTNKSPSFTKLADTNPMKQAVNLTPTGSEQQKIEPKRSPRKVANGDGHKVAGDSVGNENRSNLPPPTTAAPTSMPNNIKDCETSAKDTTRPQISMPNSVSSKPGFFDDSNNEKNTIVSSGKSNENASVSSDKKTAGKVDSKKSSSGGNSSANSGWFGGIWNKLSLKPKNQMILPDDKNPAIVWDPDKKRWINTDGDENQSESFKPPPKMADIVQNAYNANTARLPNAVNEMPVANQTLQPPQLQPQQPQIQSQEIPQQMNYGQPDVPMMSATSNISQSSTSPGLISSATNNSMSASGNASITPGAAGDQVKKPSLQSNMFKMQRNRTLKKSYVDVFNPSGAPTKPIEPVLAPMMPTATVPKAGIFVPAPVPNEDGGAQHQQSQEGMPQFYNPNQFSGYQQQ